MKMKMGEWGHIVRRRWPKLFLVLIVGCTIVALAASGCFATNFYPGGFRRCLNSSGGRSNFHSVQYACDRATAKPQNACTAWLGPVGNSGTRTIRITAPSINSTVTIGIYGMCTDRADRASALAVAGDGGSIGSGSGQLGGFTRSGTWGSPSSTTTTINVAKFIQGAAIVNGAYYRRVGLGRTHSNNLSNDYEPAEIYITIGGEIPKPEPENPATLCEKWAPSGSLNHGASAYYGTTTINIKVKNMNTRFGETGFGDWNDGTIYAMPTDEIGWVECYYGGTPGTGHTRVSSINGAQKTYTELSDSWCQSDGWYGISIPGAGFYPYVGVGAASRTVTYYELWSRSPVWQNQFNIWGSAQVVRPGDSVANGSYDVFTNKTEIRRNGYMTKQGEAGATFTESGLTGGPQYVNITGSDPSHTINKSYYETTETDYNSPKTCTQTVTGVAPNPLYNPLVPGSLPYINVSTSVTITDGEKCGYNTYQLPHYDGYSCTNKYSGTLWDASVNYSPSSDSASVQIPYNFETRTGVMIGSDFAYSGETIDVDSIWVSVGAKDNAVTQASYATQVPDGKLKLFAYLVSDPDNGGIDSMVTGNSNACDIIGGAAKQCMEFDSRSGITFNSGGNLAGSYEERGGGTYNAFDASAGDYMCFVSAVYPASSGPDTQMGTGGDGNWRYSTPSCRFIAKKPTFQVWGDGMYSVGNIQTATAAKNNIYATYFSGRTNLCKSVCYEPDPGKTKTHVYVGSWVEEALNISGGITKTLASGAAMGRNSNIFRIGNTTNNICKLSPLTLANDCKTVDGMGAMGKSNIPSLATTANREDLINYWIKGGTNKGSCGSVWGGSCTIMESASGKGIYYVNGGNLSVSGTIPKNTTYLVKASGNVDITGDLVYDKGVYSLIGQIPKVVIYANNVNIHCGVNEVDAIIIASGNTSTCSNPSGDDYLGDGFYTAHNRDRQLKIFGTVMTKSIDLGRTYGSAANETGSRTDRYGTLSDGAPAEIFDYDSTMMMWSEYMGGAAETDTLQTVYQHELAPRY